MKIIELETWRDIDAGVGYQVSSHGRVRSPRGIVNPFRCAEGHMKVGITTPVGRRTKLLTTLVAEAFVGWRPPGHYLHFKDDNPNNFRADNLEYRATRVRPAGRSPYLPIDPFYDRPESTRPTVQPKRFTGQHGDFRDYWSATPDIINIHMDGTTAVLTDREDNRIEIRPGEWFAARFGTIIVIPWKKPRPEKSAGAS